MTPRMVKCISVRQPWATLLVLGVKPVENRTWSTKYRGELYIHAGKAYDKEDVFYEIVEGLSAADRQKLNDAGIVKLSQIGFGAIIGSVNLDDIVTDCTHKYANQELGTFHWMVTARSLVFPVPWKGQLGLFEVPENLAVSGMSDQRIRAV